MAARPAEPDIPLVPWPELVPMMKWQQGEHVTLVGPTGQGKTTLMKSLLEQRGHVAVIATKPEDDTLDSMRRRGYKIIRRWPPPATHRDKVLLWPRLDDLTDVQRQATVVRHALLTIWQQGAYCIAADEARYVCKNLGCQDIMELLWLQGRSHRVSVVAATQRPRHLPLEAFSQATHLFLWRARDKYDVDRLAGLGTISSDVIRRTISNLPRYHVLYVNTRDDMLAVTRAPH